MTEFAGGIQYHHSRSLFRACDHGSNLAQYLSGVYERTSDPAHKELAARAIALIADIQAAAIESEGRKDHLALSDPALWAECHYGKRPWPDEPGVMVGFTPICHCQRRCLVHDTQAPWASAEDCNCNDTCPRHGEKVVDHDIGPLPAPDPKINPRHYGMPYRG